MAHQTERYIPPRQKLDPLSIVTDYATHPRLEYRYVILFFAQEKIRHAFIISLPPRTACCCWLLANIETRCS